MKLLILLLFLPVMAYADEDLYAKWLAMRLMYDQSTQTPNYLKVPPVKQGDGLSDVQTKYISTQTQGIIDDLKEKSSVVRTVDAIAKNPPSVQVSNIKNTMSYDTGSSKVLMKSEYDVFTLKESYNVVNSTREVELSDLLDKESKFSCGVRYSHQTDSRAILFLEKKF